MKKSFESVASLKHQEISEKEFEKRLELLKTIGKVIGEDFGMVIRVGDKPGWRYISDPHNMIEVDRNDLAEKGVEYCLGQIVHEGSRRRVSKIDFIPKDVWNASGFSFLMNAVEYPRVNNWVGGRYDGAKKWLDVMFLEDLRSDQQIEKTSQEKVGYVPKHIKFGLEVIRYWYTGEYSNDIPEDVLATLQKTQEYIQMAYETLPDFKKPSDQEIQDKAELMYRIVYSVIWPEYKKLLEKAKDEEKLRKMLEEMNQDMKQGEGDPQESDDKGTDSSQQNDPQEGESDKEGEENPSGEQGGQKGAPEFSQEEIDEMVDQIENGDIPQNLSDEKGRMTPLDQLPQEVQDALQEMVEKKLSEMSDEQRKELEEKVKKQVQKDFDELEKDLNEELRGKFNDQPNKEDESDVGKDSQKEKEVRAKMQKEERQKKLEEIERSLEDMKSEYEKIFEEVKPLVDKVAEDLENILIQSRFPNFRPGFPGQRLRLKGAMKWESRKDYKTLFEQRKNQERTSLTFSLLIDLSASMRGDKIKETVKATVMLSEVLERLGGVADINFQVFGFQDQLIPFKSLDDRYEDVQRDSLAVMANEVYGSGLHNQCLYNNDGYCLDTLLEEHSNITTSEHIILVLSDGSPEGDGSNRVKRYKDISENDELRGVVKDISKMPNTKIIGLGLGEGTEHVADFYDDSLDGVENVPNVKISELADVIAKKIEALII